MIEYFEKDGIPYRRDGLQRPEKYHGNGQWVPYYNLWSFDLGADKIDHAEAQELMRDCDDWWKKAGAGAYRS